MKAIINNRKSKKEMKKSMFCLGIELTRKCNLNCNFCSRGEVQNLTITKQIIDKILYEVLNVPIFNIRINGGEPFLVPEMFCYLVDEIIKHHIVVNNVDLFTNGTIKNESVKNAMSRLAEYLVKIENEYLEHFVKYFRDYKNVYNGTDGKKVYCIVSTKEHNNSEHINDTMIFYNQIDNPYFAVVSQDDTAKNKKSNLIISGNAEKNYKKIIDKKININDIRIINNDYDIITECDDEHIFINKTLTVSANGNVFPGCLMSYEDVDKKPMFNILNCNNDFFDRIDTFCWQNPLCKKGNKLRGRVLALQWAKEHNIDVENDELNKLESYELLDNSLREFEKSTRDLHKIVPYLNHTECKLMALSKVCLDILNIGKDKNIAKEYISSLIIACFDVDKDQIKYFIDVFWLRGFILDLSEKNNQRAKN